MLAFIILLLTAVGGLNIHNNVQMNNANNLLWEKLDRMTAIFLQKEVLLNGRIDTICDKQTETRERLSTVEALVSNGKRK